MPRARRSIQESEWLRLHVHVVLVVLFVQGVLFVVVEGQVDGLVHTANGYDNLRGNQAICWSAPRFSNATDTTSTTTTSTQTPILDTNDHNDESKFQGKQWQNKLVPDFIAGHTTMLPSCPTGTSLHLDLLEDTAFQQYYGSSKLRTHHYYTFQFTLDVDLHSIRRDYGLTDAAFLYSDKRHQTNKNQNNKKTNNNNNNNPLIAIQLQFCPLSGNLCTPFLYKEEAEAPQQLEGKIQTGGDDDVVTTEDDYDQRATSPSTTDQDDVTSQQEDQHNHQRRLRNHKNNPTRRNLQALLTESPAPTVAELFDRIDQALNLLVEEEDDNADNNNDSLHVSRVQAHYHDEYGFPEQIVIDYQKPQSSSPARISTKAVISLNDDVYLATISNLRILRGGQSDEEEMSTTTSSASNTISMNGLPSHHLQLLKLAQAKALWNASEIVDYTYNYNVHYDGLPATLQQDNGSSSIVIDRQDTPYPWLVTVHDGLVRTVVDANHKTLFRRANETIMMDNHHETPADGDHNDDYWQMPDHDNDTTSHASDHAANSSAALATVQHPHTDVEHTNQHAANSTMAMSHTGDDEQDHHSDGHFLDEDAVFRINAAKGSIRHQAGEPHYVEERTRDFAAGASPIFYIEVDKSANKSIFQIHYNIDIQVKRPGDYLPLATVMFFMHNDTTTTNQTDGTTAMVKFDVANLLSLRSITYFAPITINEVTKGVAIATYVIISICAAVQIFFLICTIRYRNDNVMKLSQITPIMLLQLSTLVAIIGTFFYRPMSDWSCIITPPLKFIPLQVVFAIIFGRLRRIITIMAPLMDLKATNDSSALKKGLKNWTTVMMGAPSGIRRVFTDSNGYSSQIPSTTTNSEHGATDTANNDTNEPETRGTRISLHVHPKKAARRLRQEFSEGRLWCLIFLVTLPMLIVQIFGLVFYPTKRVLVLNEEESIGRYQCGDKASLQFEFVSLGVLFVTIMVDLYEAQSSNSLPAFFNESKALSTGVFLSLFVMGVCVAVILVSKDPTGDPDLLFMMEVLMVLFTSLNISIRLILPKLRLIWKGEKVVVSRLLHEHKQKQKSKNAGDQNTGGPIISGLNDYETPVGNLDDRDEFGHDNQLSPEPPSACEPEEARPARRRLVVKQGQAPPSKLTIQLVRHSNTISRINDKVLAGFQIQSSEWMDVKGSVDEFQSLLETVDFR
ncbi:expressed unknown protein [Seminavis robusta]|uniref:G-protein coupled receptors family 3 profile domain-containing protein n=1 Tax=Seminavis robusta TaxID=568900 RepID=A0A9N8DNG2_9STRA|nr:expressed unknown protein [Seminavis robusta]|eukprot:Sro259_g101240.1 n/a (1185) ;mRNA; f:6504-11051